jgi:hypothetical protein
MRQMRQLAMLDKLRKQDGLVRRLVKKTQDGTLGTPTDDQALETDDMLQVGDNMIVQQSATGVSKLLAATAILAGMVGACGLGLGLATIVRPAAAPIAPVITAPSADPPTAASLDRDTLYELRLVE